MSPTITSELKYLSPAPSAESSNDEADEVSYAYEALPPMSAKEYLRQGPLVPNVADGWPGTFWDRDMLDDDHPIYQYPRSRPTAEEFSADMEALAGTDRPSRYYPDDFFSSKVIHGDQD